MITDDSLREGMQAPGISFSVEEKLSLAKRIAECGISRILVSYPPAHRSEVYVASELVKRNYFREVYGLGRAIREDIDLINGTGANISLHFPFKYDSLEDVYRNVEYAVSLAPRVEVAVVDITQYDTETLVKIVERLSKIGVDTIQLPDTMGKATPALIRKVISEAKKVSSSDIEIHCHNDKGMSMANAIAGIEAGADMVDATFLGLGERNGITDMGSMAQYLDSTHLAKSLNIERIQKLSMEFYNLVIKKAGISFFANNIANIGKNIITHTAGTHAAFSDVFHGEEFSVNVYTGKGMLKKILGTKNIELSRENIEKLMDRIKDISSNEGRVIGVQEILKEAENFVQSN
ncbi:MAG: hypothetical protein ACYCSO_01850 [Cuniculiplasma sp.]